MKKRICSVVLALLLILSPVAAFAAGSVAMQTGSATAYREDTVTLTVTVRSNSGFSYLRLTPRYDEKVLKLVSYDNGTVFQDCFTAGSVNLVWDADENVKKTGKLFTATFTVAPDAAYGDYPVAFIVRECFALDESAVQATLSSGKVTVIERHVHRWGSWTRVDGQTHRRVCETDTAHSETAPHVWDEGSITKQPSCTATGVKTFTCADCAATRTETIAVTAHTPVQVAAVPPTCTKTGATAGSKCSVCGKTLSGLETIPAKGHTPVAIPGKAATYESDGLTEGQKCSVCGEILLAQRVIPALQHIPVTVKGKPATCTEDGLTDGLACAECDIIFEEQQVIPALGHDWDDGVTVVEPTCDTDGFTGYTCRRCGEKRVEPIPAPGHSLGDWQIWFDSEKGMVERRVCSICMNYEERKAERNPAIGDVVGVSYTMSGIRGAEDANIIGRYDRSMLTFRSGVSTLGGSGVAGDVPEGVSIAWYSHSPYANDTGMLGLEFEVKGHGETSVTFDVTNWDGSAAPKDKTITFTIPHVAEEITAVEAGCETTGLSAGQKCSVCGEILKAQETTPALGHIDNDKDDVCDRCGKELVCKHVWDAGTVTREATCAEAGEKRFTCTKCGTTRTESIDKLAHTPAKVAGKAATCTEKGLTDGEKCSVCGTVLTAQKEIPATGHKAVTVPGKAATCTEKGLTDGEKCSVCGTVITAQKETPATGHKAVKVAGKAATCTEKGLTDGEKCSVCGAVITAQKEIPATGHKTVKVSGKAATCTEKGLTDGEKCTVCGTVITAQKEIPATGHKAVKVAGKAATCTEAGLTDGEKCSVCGEILKAQEEIPALGHKTEAVPGKAATCTETGLTDGEKCSVCGEVLKAQEEIPALGHTAPNEDGKCERCGEQIAEPVPKGLRGDANLDGKVLANDARLVLRASAKLETLEGQGFINCDLNGDGKLLAGEARKILRFSAKLETEI